MSPKPLVSVIIRTKNEERWITPCFEVRDSISHKISVALMKIYKKTNNV